MARYAQKKMVRRRKRKILKNEFNLKNKKTLVMSVDTFDTPVISLKITEKGEEDIELFKGTIEEVNYLVSHLSNRLGEIEQMENFGKAGWKKE